jgi:glutamine synthetase
MKPSLAELAGVDDDARRAALAHALELVRSQELHTLLISMCDGSGASRVKSFRASDLERIARSGIPYQSGVLSLDSGADFVAGTGFDFELRGGCFLLLPDPSTLTPTPWSPGTGVLMGDAYFEDGRPVDATPRHTARRLLAALAARGLEISWGWEFEFYTFRRDASGELSPTTPDGQALHQVRHRQVEPMLDALRRWLAPAGIELDDAIHEYGPGQLEVNFPPGRGLAAIDRAFLFKHAVKEILAREGVVATFMTKPIQGRAASACHIHQAVYDSAGTNVFADETDPDGISEACRRWMGGQCVHAAGLTALTTPTVNGYKRYRPMSLAPDRILWGEDNKGAMVRVVGDPPTHLENRSAEPAANPYLAIAAQVVSGLDGVDRGLDPGDPTHRPYSEDAARLPGSLMEALDALDADPVFATAFGADVVSWIATLKRAEVTRYLQAVTDWEQREYYDLL